MLIEKFNEALELLKQHDPKALRKNKTVSDQIDLCAKLYNRANEDINQKYYTNLFIEEADKLILLLNNIGNPSMLQSVVDSLEAKRLSGQNLKIQ